MSKRDIFHTPGVSRTTMIFKRKRALLTAGTSKTSARKTSGARVSHIAFVDSFRALLALYVVALHCAFSVWPQLDGVGRDGLGRLAMVFFHGHLAVAAFIFVSGFCLMLPVARYGCSLRAGTTGFYVGRIKRIVPTFYAAVALAWALNGLFIDQSTHTIWAASLPISWPAVLANLTMTQNLMFVSSVNYVFWSIAVEFQIYLLFPLLVWMWRTLDRVAVAVAVLAVSAVLGGAVLGTRWQGLHPHFLGLFVVGMWVATTATGGRQSVSILKGVIALGIAACVGWFCLRTFGREWVRVVAADYAFVFIMAIILTDWCRAVPRLAFARRWMSTRGLVLLGTISYSLYLVHAPMIQITWQLFVRGHGYTPAAQLAVLLATAVPASVVVAIVFFYLFERPFLSSRQKRAVLEATPAPALAVTTGPA